MKLTKTEIEDLLPKIKQVLATGEMWEDENLHHPAGAIIKAVLSIEGVKKVEDGFSTNGWEYDWWQKFEYQGKQYVLSGSGWLGGHSFYPDDD